MFPIRVERWGHSWRVLQFKGLKMDGKRRKIPHAHNFLEDEGEFWERKWSEEGERLRTSIARTRSRIRELALCNDFEYFCTFTLSPEKQDRYDLKRWIKDFGTWVGNYNKKYNTKLEYLIIPEQHKNGAWHAHGLVKGIAPQSIVVNEHGYYDMPYYAQRFGFMNFSTIKSRERCASYITKYVTKDVASTARAIGRSAHMFYHSQGLREKEVIWTGYGDFKGDYENAFVKWAFVDFKHAMEIMGRGILAFKDPHKTLSQYIRLETSYEREDFINELRRRTNVQPEGVCLDSARTADPDYRGSKSDLARVALWSGFGQWRFRDKARIDPPLLRAMGDIMGDKAQDRTQEQEPLLTLEDYEKTPQRRARLPIACFTSPRGTTGLYADAYGAFHDQLTFFGKGTLADEPFSLR